MSLVRLTIRLLSERSKNLPSKGITCNDHRKGFLIVAATMMTTNSKNQKNCKTNSSNIGNFQFQQQKSFEQDCHELFITKQLQQQKQQKFPTFPQHNVNFCNQIAQRRHFSTTSSYLRDNRIVTHELTKSLTLFSDKPRNVDMDKKNLKLKEQKVERPLCLMFAWLLAGKKHLSKYANIYIELGFDVMTVEVSPWQFLWPTKGSQIVARDVLKFLENNPMYTPIILHGFSVGAYVWGEIMVLMAREPERYKPIIDKIVAQIWDSAADITEISVGVPKAIFPKNQTLQDALRNYTLYHMKKFHRQATQHYIRSSQMFHSPITKAPSLFLLSKNDPIGSESSNLSVKESMESIGIKCTWICWERSAHAQHYRFHHDEYMKYLLNHLEVNVMDKISQKKQVEV